MALMKKLAILVFLLVSSFVLAGETMSKEIEILSPSDGAKVRLLHPLQRDWMTMPREKRVAKFGDVKDFRAKLEKTGTRPQPVRLSWRCKHPEGKDCAGTYTVEVMHRRSGRRHFFVENLRTNEVEITNLEVGESYTWCVWCGKHAKGADFKTEDLAPRLLDWKDVAGNVRDLGGWKTKDGFRVRQGVAFRSAGLNDNALTDLTAKETLELYEAGQLEAQFGKKGKEIADLLAAGKIGPDDPRLRKTFERKEFRKGRIHGTEESREFVRKFFGIRTDLDLRRGGSECWGMTGSPLGANVAWRNLPGNCYDGLGEKKGKKKLRKGLELFLDRGNYGIVFHCIGGADRTGSLAFVINALLGVDEEDLWRDWEATGFDTSRDSFTHAKCLDKLVSVFGEYEGATINERVENYVKSLGYKQEDIERLRDILLDRGGPYRDLRGLPLWHKAGGVKNLRDVGGWTTTDGKKVRTGRLFRSGALEGIKSDGVEVLVSKLGVKTDLDLRRPEQIAGLKGKSPLGAGVKLVNFSSFAYQGFDSDAGKECFAKTFRFLVNEAEYPVVMHCVKGADRTGSWAFFLNGLLGVPEADLRYDWEVTHGANGNPLFKHCSRYDRLLAVVEKRSGRTLAEKIVSFAKECGVTDGEIAKWRSMMLEGGEAAAVQPPSAACGIAIADLCDYVNPFVGTDGPGHTYPAAARPFGMVQAGPDTGTGAWDYCSGYQYRDQAILGYSQTHLNGTGCPDLGDIQVLPFSGEVGKLPMKRRIDKSSEKASPGWYEVCQPDDGVKVEIAAAKRAAIYRFTWERGRLPKILVNIPFGIEQPWTNYRVKESDVTICGLAGFRGMLHKTGWVKNRKLAFRIEFDRPWTSVEELPRDCAAPRYVVAFGTGEKSVVLMKIALSMSDADAAERNLEDEIPDWNVERVRDEARDQWNGLLSRTTCGGSDDQKRNWYTALYHLYLQPNDYSDIGKKPYYTTLSLWDTFRASHPWYSIVTPEIVRPVIDSTMELWRQNGRLPVMSYGGKNIDCMIGNHSIPVIVDAFLKEGRKEKGRYWEEVFAAIKNTLTQAHAGKPKEDWGLYDKYGYFPCDIIRGESVSRTFECCYDDWCAAQMAKGLGKMDDYAFFMKRAQNWKNVFDSSIGFGRGKTTAGKWREPFDPYALGHGADTDNDFTEGNAFQYSWHVMQDVPGLVAAMGGREKFVARLDSLFAAPDKVQGAGMVVDVTGLIGQYVHGNEPSHHVIYFYPQVGQPEKAAERIREVFDKFYLPKVDGLCGNDDCGQMSAWYLFSAMGFYPFNPCGGEYVIGAPQVPMAQVKVRGEGEQWRLFTMTAKNLSKENKYVKSVTLNGKPITDWKICHEDIVKGGELVFEMVGR